MTEYDAYEKAYKNGIADGKKEAETQDVFAEIIQDIFRAVAPSFLKEWNREIGCGTRKEVKDITLKPDKTKL